MTQVYWQRHIKLTLKSKVPLLRQLREYIIDDIGGNTYSMTITGTKYMSSLKDSCTIKISNLPYDEILLITQNKFFEARVEVGYVGTALQTIFLGEIMYITNFRESIDTNTVTILCASKLVAAYGQSRMNLTFNSGINMYAAIKFLCNVNNIKDITVTNSLKASIIRANQHISDRSFAEWLYDTTTENGALCLNTDASKSGSYGFATDLSKAQDKILTISNESFVFCNGFPRLTEQGCTFSVLPTYGLQCANIVQIDNSILNIGSPSSASEIGSITNGLDSNGQYVIFEIHYALQNRGTSFYLNCDCKARKLISTLIEGAN